MFFDCNAPFITCALLSTFATVTEKERDAVRFIIELIPCYMQDGVAGKLRMTFDVHVLAQIFLAELRVLASRHSYIHEGSLEEAAQARALLDIVVMPLIRHLRVEEYNVLLETIDEAYFLLSRPLDVLDELMIIWHIRNAKVATAWRSHPVGNLENYEFGVELPDNCLLEDLLSPLPYPTRPKPFSAAVVEHASEQSEVSLAGSRMRLIDFDGLKAPPRSECSKELELKEKAKPNSNMFAIPFLGRSRGSFDSRSQYSHSSGSNRTSWIYEHEDSGKKPQETINDQEMDNIMFVPDHKRDWGMEIKLPRRKRLSLYEATF